MSMFGVFPEEQLLMNTNSWMSPYNSYLYNNMASREWMGLNQEERMNFLKKQQISQIKAANDIEFFKIQANDNFDNYSSPQIDAVKKLELAIKTNPEHVVTCLNNLKNMIRNAKNVDNHSLNEEEILAKAITLYNRVINSDFYNDINTYVPGSLSQGFSDGLRLNTGSKINKYNLMNELNGVNKGTVGKFDNAVGNAAGLSVGTTVGWAGFCSLAAGTFYTLCSLKKGKNINKLLEKGTDKVIKYLKKYGLAKDRFVKDGKFDDAKAKDFIEELKANPENKELIPLLVNRLRANGVDITDDGHFNPMTLYSLYEDYAKGGLFGLRTGLMFAPITATIGAYTGYNNIDNTNTNLLNNNTNNNFLV